MSALTAKLSPPPRRRSLKTSLYAAFALLSTLILLIAAAALWGVQRASTAASSAIDGDGRLSWLASEVAITALEVRAYEQQLLFRLDEPEQRTATFVLWRRSTNELRAAIERFGSATSDPADLDYVRAWREAQEGYDQNLIDILSAVTREKAGGEAAGEVDVAVLQELMDKLSAEAVAVAEAKTATALQTGDELAGVTRDLLLQVGLSVALALTLAAAISIQLPGLLLRPLRDLRATAARLADGDMSARATAERDDELGALAHSFNRMADTIAQRTADREAQLHETEAARMAAECAQEQAEMQLATIAAQRAVIAEMSVPVLPLANGTLVMPLIGALDSARLAQVQERALHSIERVRARHLLLDITGVPVVDTQVARGLVEVVQAARLLGAKVTLVGIRPEVAQTVVGLGATLEGVTTRATLADGLRG